MKTMSDIKSVTFVPVRGEHPLCSEDGFEKALTLTLRDKFKTAWLFLYFAFCCSQRFLLHLTHQTAMVFLKKKEKKEEAGFIM